MLDVTLKENARRAAGRGAASAAGALRKAGDVSGRTAATLADSLDHLATAWAPKSSRKSGRWVGGALAIVLVVALIALIARRQRRSTAVEPAASSATDLEAVREERSAS